jgi:GNAT superfamily N-acetyltransferase
MPVFGFPNVPVEAHGHRYPDVEYAEGFAPGYLGRIAQMHGEYYARAWGSGPAFESLMARELCDFYDGYDIARDLLLTAHVNGTLVGCVAVHGSQSERPNAARLRWYLLADEFQGLGIGGDLLQRALDFCRSGGFAQVFLWTVEGLPASHHLYEKVGFRIVQRFVDARYTVEHTQLLLEMPLLPAKKGT